MRFTNETGDSSVKIHFTYEIFISRIELKHIHKLKTLFICDMACEIFVMVNNAVSYSTLY